MSWSYFIGYFPVSLDRICVLTGPPGKSLEPKRSACSAAGSGSNFRWAGEEKFCGAAVDLRIDRPRRDRPRLIAGVEVQRPSPDKSKTRNARWPHRCRALPFRPSENFQKFSKTGQKTGDSRGAVRNGGDVIFL